MYSIFTMSLDDFKEELALQLFGRSASLAMAGQSCVACGGRADKFRDELSRREYKISGLCQKCQDDVFVEPAE